MVEVLLDRYASVLINDSVILSKNEQQVHGIIQLILWELILYSFDMTFVHLSLVLDTIKSRKICFEL